MDPSKDKNQADKPAPKRKATLSPAVLCFLLIAILGGIGFYFYSETKTAQVQTDPESIVKSKHESSKPSVRIQLAAPGDFETTPVLDKQEEELSSVQTIEPAEPLAANDALTTPQSPLTKQLPPPVQKIQPDEKISSCDKSTFQLNEFYKHLDSQPYMATFQLSSSSKNHFTALIKKLLNNPPQVTRESDDLYTILKNTAHFFRVSGKDNILMLKGILDNEKGKLEQILADYYLLVTNPKCSLSSYGSAINNAALYEYACFFLNTMGGRLYLFRRDSQSRMVVTYYAILLVDLANTDNNNRHGIALKPFIDMLIAEMETGGSALKQKETYLDTLYDFKEKYQ